MERKTKLFTLLATIVLGLAVVYFFTNKKDDPQIQMSNTISKSSAVKQAPVNLSQYYTPPVGNRVRGNDALDNIGEIEKLIYDKKFEEAKIMLLTKVGSDDRYDYLLAHVYFNEKEYEKAKELFKKIDPKQKDLYDQSQYYLALINIELDNADKAIEMLLKIGSDKNHLKNEEAKKLYSKITDADFPLIKNTASIHFKEQDDYILIQFNNKKDLSYERMIEVFNAKGKRIFKAYAKPNEMISEINMNQVKSGEYKIKVTLEDGAEELSYTKEG